MIRIHHATAKKATEAGIMLEVIHNEEGTDIGVMAQGRTGAAIYAETAKAAVEWALLEKLLRAEYPALTIVSSDEDELEIEAFRPVVWSREKDEAVEIAEQSGEVPTIAEIAEACEAAGIDPEAEIETEEGEGEDKGKPGNVVPAKYRDQYKERGNPDHCGDWLARFLDGAFSEPGATPKARPTFNADAFDAFLRDNGVPMEGKWTTLRYSGQKGWEGRYRMNGRQIAEKHIARTGFVILGGKTHEIPADVLSELRAKHALWIEKQNKKDAKAAEAAEQASE